MTCECGRLMERTLEYTIKPYDLGHRFGKLPTGTYALWECECGKRKVES